jgi:hypothetical protein
MRLRRIDWGYWLDFAYVIWFYAVIVYGCYYLGTGIKSRLEQMDRIEQNITNIFLLEQLRASSPEKK